MALQEAREVTAALQRADAPALGVVEGLLGVFVLLSGQDTGTVGLEESGQQPIALYLAEDTIVLVTSEYVVVSYRGGERSSGELPPAQVIYHEVGSEEGQERVTATTTVTQAVEQAPAVASTPVDTGMIEDAGRRMDDVS